MRKILVLTAALLCLNRAFALDVSAVLDAAVEQDIQIRQLTLSLANAELQEQKRRRARGISISLSGLGPSYSQTFGSDGSIALQPRVTAALGSPYRTSASVTVPFE